MMKHLCFIQRINYLDMKMPVSDLSYWRKGDAVHLSINRCLPWYIELMEDYLEKEGNKKTGVVIKSGGTPD